MKKMLWLGMILLTLGLTSCFQQRGVGQISVAGQADLEIEADEFYITLQLREYFLEELSPYTDANALTTLGPNILVLEEELQTNLQELGLEHDALRLQNAGSQAITRYYNNSSTRSRTEVRTRSYQLMVKSMEIADAVLSLELPHGSTASMYDMRNSQIEEFKLMAKRMALENARLRADNLAKGYGKIVGLIFVSEDDSRITQQQGETGMIGLGRSSNLNREMVAMNDGGMLKASADVAKVPVATRKIIIHASVDAVFAVQ